MDFESLKYIVGESLIHCELSFVLGSRILFVNTDGRPLKLKSYEIIFISIVHYSALECSFHYSFLKVRAF